MNYFRHYDVIVFRLSPSLLSVPERGVLVTALIAKLSAFPVDEVKEALREADLRHVDQQLKQMLQQIYDWK